MHVIARSKLIEFWKKHPEAEIPLKTWHSKVRKARWKNFHDIRKDFPSADPVGNNRVVFDIRGNEFRLICLVFFSGQKAYIRFIGTHAAYDKIKDIKNI